MPSTKSHRIREIFLVFAIIVFTAGAPSTAATRKTLHAFQGDPDAAAPESNLVMDAHGDLYGTSYSGGDGPCEYGCGTVFELSPDGTGGYAERVIHTFQGPLVDGQQPQAPLIFDAQGNLYGTTLAGGRSLEGNSGTVFRLSPRSDRTWTETILYSFRGGVSDSTDGAGPLAGLVFDAAGNLYGTTAGGGTGTACGAGIVTGCGTIFELSPAESGPWQETILHNFTNNHTDGWSPQSNLIMDRSGNFYGTTYYGGSAPEGGGTVFRLSHSVDGWQETVLYNFTCRSDGCSPYSGLSFDAVGNLYGTTAGGGDSTGQGVVYKLTRNGAGGWTERVIHMFMGNTDGMYPYGNPILDASGNVYGTTLDGGGGTTDSCADGCGTVYKLAPGPGGSYTESILSRFGNGEAGGGPLAGLFMASGGNLYGAAAFSGPHGAGVVFEILP
ncbi:MAG: choice-of-anchor tandem repeat GloVer-containing protein [Bryobacteraceae bacterium]|jgi:uncharacterized repeat protein (TIGR03803 family)